ncbi:MAG TPA: glycerol-3-phosphate acyltransferase, partial [SAR324 cluster bacterium]|nr:glycerol-3-phosphate acyltransferase [SAR324 cluster bacterium]
MFVGKIWLGTDVRQQGSGNIGMTNVMRIGGKGPGVLTFVLDFLKGWLAVFLAASALNPEETQTQYAIIWLSAVAVSAVCGHVWCVWGGGGGGKGVSTLFGSLAALYFEIALICAIIWVLMFLLKKISSLSALTMLIIMPWLFLLMPWIKEVPFSGYQFIIMIALSGLMIYKHQENIVRLLKGKEGKL